MSAFPWENAMRFGLGVLRLAPREFWAMTPRELSVAFSVHSKQPQSQAPIKGTDFASLMKKFPDLEQGK